MTGNSKEIKKLKNEQAKKKKTIERYKKRKKKHIFFLVLPFIAYIFICMDHAYKLFGSVSRFLAITLTALFAAIIVYLFIVQYMIRQRDREIKIIRSKLYKLMKLSNE